MEGKFAHMSPFHTLAHKELQRTPQICSELRNLARRERERESDKHIWISKYACVWVLWLEYGGRAAPKYRKQQQSNNKRPHTVIERVGERVPRQKYQLVFAFGHNTWRIICCGEPKVVFGPPVQFSNANYCNLLFTNAHIYFVLGWVMHAFILI